MFLIRKAIDRDAKPLSELAERTFRETFGAVNTPENMELHCGENYSEAIQTREFADPAMLTLLAAEGDTLIGFAQLRWGDVPRCVVANSPGEIKRLYIAKEWHGKGVAQALMTASIKEIQDRGADLVWLGVWEHNPRAISFYRKFGFAEAGELIFSLGNDPQRDLVMVRPLRN